MWKMLIKGISFDNQKLNLGLSFLQFAKLFLGCLYQAEKKMVADNTVSHKFPFDTQKEKVEPQQALCAFSLIWVCFDLN